MEVENLAQLKSASRHKKDYLSRSAVTTESKSPFLPTALLDGLLVEDLAIADLILS